MTRIVQVVAGLAAVLVSCGVSGAEGAHARRVQQAQVERDAEDVLAAVVRVKMTAVPNARSNATLGPSREGTGIVIDERGHIVTIGYIVIEADSIEITTQDNRTVAATLVGYDHASGFGLLRAGAPLGVKPMPMGQAADVAQREPVMVLPAGGRDAASLAYVVAKRKFAASWEYLLDTAIFTSPPSFQWAGAALVSREGKLIGVGSLLVREAQDGSQAPGNMFVPIDLLKPILADLIEKGRRSGPARPWLGLATEEMHGHLLVTRVSPEGPADRAGIRNGDIVIGVGSDPVKNHEELYRKVWGLGAAGVDVPLRILQGVDMRELKVRSIDRFQYFKEKPVY
ncbi:MAG TPA: S1C family serine protease [Burkholderiales bacterium]|nr:S1C family serine protease [Burkholderiales bacterium]